MAGHNLADETQDISTSSSSITLSSTAHVMNSSLDVEKIATEQADQDGSPAKPVMTALDWTGVDDPENPENWTTGKKAFHICYVGIQCFVMYVLA